MKVRFLLFLSLLAVGSVSFAQTKFWVCKSDYTSVEYNISDVDSITFTPPFVETISVDPHKKEIVGGANCFTVHVTSNTTWDLRSTQEWLRPSVADFDGNSTYAAFYDENKSLYNDTAYIYHWTVKDKRADTIMVVRNAAPLQEEKCKASDYGQVTIGSQTWMTENYRCSKYDTDSEAYAAGIRTIPTKENEDLSIFPFHADAARKSAWNETSRARAECMTAEEIQKLGYLYNWAAVVGFTNESDIKRKEEFSGNRQGICPNGWHVPTLFDWISMFAYIKDQKELPSTLGAAQFLKTKTGWYMNGGGDDSYGFASLASGDAIGVSVADVGTAARYWTAKPFTNNEDEAYYVAFTYDTGYYFDNTCNKYYACAVRCLKN